MKKTEAMKSQNIMILIILIIIFMITITFYAVANPNFENSINKAKVTRVIDGDTFEIENGKIIRLLCVNAPEKNEKGFIESKNFLESLILNKIVSLKEDKTNVDKYDRLLRYVYLEENNYCSSEELNKPNELVDSTCVKSNSKIFINRELVKNDFAKLETYGNMDCNILLS